jgi:hypothetical protein
LFCKLFIFAFSFITFSPIIASAAQITLEWDENDEKDLAGYRVFYRQQGHNYDYYNPVWEGTENWCTLSGDFEDTICFFVVRAFNSSGTESRNSNEVYYQPEDSQETCTDADSDGYYARSGCGTEIDCNDSDPDVNPSATEICSDTIDNDCDGLIDCSDPDCDCETPFDVTLRKPADYRVVPNLQPGDEYYLDRDYRIISIPYELSEGTEAWIKTKNTDKFNKTSYSFLEFTISQASTVFIAYDSRATSRPTWLRNNFNTTSLSIEVEDVDMLYFDVYSKTFPAGKITLGGNFSSGAAGAKSNYIVIVQACTAVPEICYNGLDDDLDGLIDCFDPDCDCEAPFDVTLRKPADYGVAPSLQPGDEYYLDREYRLISIPYELSEGTEAWIRTKNKDKFNKTDSFLEFTISQPATVFIAYDSRATSLPTWLRNTFNSTPLSIEVEDIDMPFFNVYSSVFPAGTITLGGSFSRGAAGAESNYIVIVKPSN